MPTPSCDPPLYPLATSPATPLYAAPFQELPAAAPVTIILLSVRSIFPPVTETAGILMTRSFVPLELSSSVPPVTLTADELTRLLASFSLPLLTEVAPV